MIASKWIDKVKLNHNIKSDYAAAKLLNMTTSAISVLRTRESTLSEESALHVGKLLGINPAIVLIDQVCERAKSEESKHAWQHAISLVTRAAQFNHSHAKQKT